ncbi:hypothetical protein B5M09_013881 [Aphanomyces astaci]|uniref:HSF-type DNA-binding domain-containing protein n=1 Tax=Aphanomyces astaci TaxID=112090 RepID=A0A3R7XTY3_APHAT|nr:hypothetical protein B5M09_013881 [Aphanomyces astaci]
MDSSKPALFLRKTWAMLEACPPHVAAWTNGGASFVIKLPKEFAATMLPKYFKHRNFHSFVRQLNFYGFRKAKTDVLVVALLANEVKTSSSWEFHHNLFHQFRPHLMAAITRKTKKTPYDDTTRNISTYDQTKHELRAEVGSIRAQLATLTNQVTYLTQLMDEQQHRHTSDHYMYPCYDTQLR